MYKTEVFPIPFKGLGTVRFLMF